MPSITNVVLKDRASTPVSHTFTPTNVSANGVGTLVVTSGVPYGNPTFDISQRKTSTGNYVGRASLIVPVLGTEVVNGVAAPTILRVGACRIEFRFDKTSTEQERKDVIGMAYSSLAPDQPFVMGVLQKLESVWGA